jgi:ketosteroid isomerase-like protein
MKNQEPDKLVEEEILRIENNLFTAIKDKDTKRLDNILAEDFVHRNPITGEQNKAEFLTAISSLPLEIISVWSEDMKVNVFSDVAVMTGTQKAKVRVTDGTEAIGATAFTDIFVKREGKWVLSLAHGVELPSALADK